MYLASPENYKKHVGRARSNTEVSKGTFCASTIRKHVDVSGFLRLVQELLRNDAAVFLKSFTQCPPPDPDKKKSRLIFVREHHYWTPQIWGRVVFSEKKRFRLAAPGEKHPNWHKLN